MVEQQPGQIINPNNQPTDQATEPQNQPQVAPSAVQATPQPPAQSQEVQAPLQSATSPQVVQQSAQEDSSSSTPQPISNADVNAPVAASFTASGFDASPNSPHEPAQVDLQEAYGSTMEQAEPITWTASEYIGHQKNSSWFFAFALALALVAGGVYFLTRDILSAAGVTVVGIVFGMYAGRKPREQTYTINNMGVAIGEKMYSYDRFKSFSIAQEGPFTSIVFMPLGRLMPMISIYYDPKDEERIADTLSMYLPYENYKRDPVDALMRKIRF